MFRIPKPEWLKLLDSMDVWKPHLAAHAGNSQLMSTSNPLPAWNANSKIMTSKRPYLLVYRGVSRSFQHLQYWDPHDWPNIHKHDLCKLFLAGDTLDSRVAGVNSIQLAGKLQCSCKLSKWARESARAIYVADWNPISSSDCCQCLAWERSCHRPTGFVLK